MARHKTKLKTGIEVSILFSIKETPEHSLVQRAHELITLAEMRRMHERSPKRAEPG